MIDYQPLLHWMQHQPALAKWAELLPAQIDAGLSLSRWGDLPAWQQVLDELPTLAPHQRDFLHSVSLGSTEDFDSAQRQALQTTLMGLHPWRKGPFELFGLTIDTEWRSDWKWDRLRPHLPDLGGQQILDVGCGNGYHCLRLFGAGAERVVGIDPSAKFVHQFYAIKHFCPDIAVDVLPLGIEQVPPNLRAFDTTLSMGVIYHRKDPVTHIRELAACLKPGGTLVLETLVVPDSYGECLIPEERYAKMRNVWCVPSPNLVLKWLAEAELSDARVVDITATSVEEQHSTPWMTFESLPDFLDPEDQSKTIEGYPAPIRAMFIARAPG